MFYHPDTVMALANEHRRELIAEADRYRLLASALRIRREQDRERKAAARARPAGTLAACGPREAAPAR